MKVAQSLLRVVQELRRFLSRDLVGTAQPEWVRENEEFSRFRRYREERNLSGMRALLESSFEAVRFNALGALSRMGDPGAGGLALIMLNDPSSRVRLRAVRILARVGMVEECAAQWETIVGHGFDADIRVGRAVARELCRMAEFVRPMPSIDARRKFAQGLKESDPWIRRYTAQALGHLGLRESVPLLRLCLGDETTFVRRATVWALGRIGDPSSIGDLILAMNDPCPGVRCRAVDALRRIGGAEATRRLVLGLSDCKWSVRRISAWALGEIGGVSEISALSEAAESYDVSLAGKSRTAVSKIRRRNGVVD